MIVRSHGKVATYVDGCRCRDCRDASAEAQRRRREARKALVAKRDDSWQEDAACRGKPTKWWFAFAGSDEALTAAKLCAGCPVRDACTEAGLNGPAGFERGRWGAHVVLGDASKSSVPSRRRSRAVRESVRLDWLRDQTEATG